MFLVSLPKVYGHQPELGGSMLAVILIGTSLSLAAAGRTPGLRAIPDRKAPQVRKAHKGYKGWQARRAKRGLNGLRGRKALPAIRERRATRVTPGKATKATPG